jgi:hypothetical protein
MLKKILFLSCVLAGTSYSYANTETVTEPVVVTKSPYFEISVKVDKKDTESKGVSNFQNPLLSGLFKPSKSENCNLDNLPEYMMVSVMPIDIKEDKSKNKLLSTILIFNPVNYDQSKPFAYRTAKESDLCKLFQKNEENAIHMSYSLYLDKPTTLELPTGDKLIFEAKSIK